MSFVSPTVRRSLAVTLAAIVASTALAQPTTKPARSMQQVTGELGVARAELKVIFPANDSFLALRDPEKRKEVADTAPAAVKKVDRLEAELAELRAAHTSPNVMMMSNPVAIMEAAQRGIILLALNDAETIAAVNAAAASSESFVAREAKAKLAVTKILVSASTEDQISAADTLLPLYKEANGTDDTFDMYMIIAARMPGSAPEVGERVNAMMSAAKPGKYTNALLRQKESANVMKKATDKPIVLAGVAPVTAKPFTTADWKGKVILVDFWASWCGPCKAELPRVKALYEKYHPQGLEILGVSNDYTQDALTSYLAEDPALAWPQIFDAASAAQHKWHPETQKYAINGIPRMFLIDRKGVLRTVEARSQMEDLIPKLLAESAN